MEANLVRWQECARNPEAAGEVAKRELLLYGGVGCHAAGAALLSKGTPEGAEIAADLHVAGGYLWEQAFSSDGNEAKDEKKKKKKQDDEGKDDGKQGEDKNEGGDGCMIM